MLMYTACMYFIRVTTGLGKSWKVVEFRQTSFQAWKAMGISKGPGKSWKIMENKSNVMHFLNYGILKLHGKII